MSVCVPIHDEHFSMNLLQHYQKIIEISIFYNIYKSQWHYAWFLHCFEKQSKLVPCCSQKVLFPYEHELEYSLFVLLIFFTSLSACLDFNHEKINRRNKDSTMSLLNFLLCLALATILSM